MALGTVTFYKYTGDPRVANKSLGTAVHTTGSLKPLEPLSNLEVRIVVNYDEDIMTANYCESEGLYYKITDRKRGLAGAAEITARLDSLLSFWSEISTCPAIIERAENAYDGEINDPLYPVKQRSEVECRRLFSFPNSDRIVIWYIA